MRQESQLGAIRSQTLRLMRRYSSIHRFHSILPRTCDAIEGGGLAVWAYSAFRHATAWPLLTTHVEQTATTRPYPIDVPLLAAHGAVADEVWSPGRCLAPENSFEFVIPC